METSTIEAEEGLCGNCGQPAHSKFCPECGQSTNTRLPSPRDFFMEFAAVFLSYDAKIWRTLWDLVSKPGKLTTAYIEGRRIRYLTPLQLFVGLQTVAFLANRELVDRTGAESDQKQRYLWVVGLVTCFVLLALNFKRKDIVPIAVVTTIHIWSFLMILLFVVYAAIWQIVLRVNQSPDRGDILTLVTVLVMAVYAVLALREVFKLGWAIAVLQGVAVFLGYACVARIQFLILTSR